MKGKPRYKLGQTVSFELTEYLYNSDGIRIENSEHKVKYTGDIYVVDKFGTFEDPSDVSYDILVEDKKFISELNKKGQCLIKHINEKYIIE